MARGEFNPLDFGDQYAIEPPTNTGGVSELEQYLPRQEAAPKAPARGGNVAALRHAFNYFLDKGLAPHQAAAIVGNIAQESGGHSRAEGGGRTAHDPYSLGYGQWNRERLHGGKGYVGLIPFAEAMGRHASDPNVQLDYMWHELQGPESKALKQLLAAKDVAEATRAFGASYERPDERFANYENRIAQAQTMLRGAPEQAPQGPPASGMQSFEVFDHDAKKPRTLTLPAEADPVQAIQAFREQGKNLERIIPHALTNNKTLRLLESADVNQALAELAKQHPDQEWMTQEHAAKTGFGAGAASAFKSIPSLLQRGAGEIAEEFGPTQAMGQEWIKSAKERQAELAKQYEAPLPTDPLLSKLGYYGGAALGSLPAAAPALMAGPAGVAAMAGTAGLSAVGSSAQRFDEQGKPYSIAEPTNLLAALGETAFQTMGMRALNPAAGKFLESAAKGAAGATAADIPSVALERLAAGQPVSPADKAAAEEYLGTFMGDVMGGGMVGGAMGRAKQPRAEVPPPAEVPPGEAPLPPEVPTEPAVKAKGKKEKVLEEEGTVEDLAQQVLEADAALKAARTVPPVTPEAQVPVEPVTPEAAAIIPEPIVEPPAPPVEAAAAPWPVEMLGLRPSQPIAKKLEKLDPNNLEDHAAIDELVTKNIQNINPTKVIEFGQYLDEVKNAQQIPEAGPVDGGRGPQPIIREEGRDQAVSGQGVEPSGQGVKAPEVSGEKVQVPEEKVDALIARVGEMQQAKPVEAPAPVEPPKVVEPPKAVEPPPVEAPKAAEPPSAVKTPEGTLVDHNGSVYMVKGTAVSKLTSKGKFSPLHAQESAIAKVVREKAASAEIEPPKAPEPPVVEAAKTIEPTAEKAVEPAAPVAEEPVAPKVSERPTGPMAPHVEAWEDLRSPTDPAFRDMPREAQGLWKAAHIEGADTKGYFDDLVEKLGPVEHKKVTQEEIDAETAKTLGAEPDPDVHLYTKGEAPEQAHTVESLGQKVKETFGEDAPEVVLSTREQEGVGPDVRGFHDPKTGRTVLIADNIDTRHNLRGLVRHEVAVHAKKLGKTDPEFQNILKQVQTLRDRGVQAVKDAYARVPEGTHPDHIHEEALGYLVEHAKNLPVVKQFMSWLRRTAHKLTGSAKWLREDDFGPMADAILKQGEKVKTAARAEGAEPLYSRRHAAEDVEQEVKTIQYDNWFDKYYTRARAALVNARSPIEYVLRELPLYSRNGNQIRSTAKMAQSTRDIQIINHALESGYLYLDKYGLVATRNDDAINPMKIKESFLAMGKEAQDKFAKAINTLAQNGHNLRAEEHRQLLEDNRRELAAVESEFYSRQDVLDKQKQEIADIKALPDKDIDVDRLEQLEGDHKALKAEQKAARDVIKARKALIHNVETRYKGVKHTKDGKVFDVSDEAVAEARAFLNSSPEVKEMAQNVRQLYKQNAKLLRDTGVISDKTYQSFIADKYDYAPLYKSIEDLNDDLEGRGDYFFVGGGQKRVGTPKKLRGGRGAEDMDRVNFLQNMFRHQAKVGAWAIHNNSKRATLADLAGMGFAKRTAAGRIPKDTAHLVAVMEDGKRRYYRVEDDGLFDAYQIINNAPRSKLGKITRAVTKELSQWMLIDPAYWYRQMWREPVMSAFMSGAGAKSFFAPFKAMGALTELATGKGTARQAYQELKGRGISGSHDYLSDERLIQLGKANIDPSTLKEKAAFYYDNAKKLGQKVQENIDAASKVTVMREYEQQLLKQGMSPEKAREGAIQRVGDMLNFANRGTAASAQYFNSTIPFFNSWAQGMDALIRHATGYGFDRNSSEGKAVMKTFWGHAAAMAAMATAYSAFMSDNKDYQNLSAENRARNWYVPLPGTNNLMKIPAAFETTVFKAVPEAIVTASLGKDPRDAKDMMVGTLWRDLMPPGSELPGVPYLVRPLLESAVGYKLSLRPGETRPIGDQSLRPELRERGKSAAADFFSDVTGGAVSPATLRYLATGYTPSIAKVGELAAKGIAAGVTSAFGQPDGRQQIRDIVDLARDITGAISNPDMVDRSRAYEFAAEQALNAHSARYAQRHGFEGVADKFREEGRYAKAAQNLKSVLSTLQMQEDRIKNSKDYKSAEAAEKDLQEVIARRREITKSLEDLEKRASEEE
jgi:hypothetical protein